MLALDAAPATVSSLAVRVYDSLRMDLLNGEWPPGKKLAMNLLRERYMSGASPLREALNRLVTEGLAVYTDQRGFAAAAVSQAELHDIVRNRIALENLALEQAFAERDADWEEALVLALHRLSRVPRSIDPDNFEQNPLWEQHHRAFHQALISGCKSPVLQGFCDQLYDQAYRYRQLAARKAYKQRHEHDEHQAIFDAVMCNDLPLAKSLLTAHFQLTAVLSTASI